MKNKIALAIAALAAVSAFGQTTGGFSDLLVNECGSSVPCFRPLVASDLPDGGRREVSFTVKELKPEQAKEFATLDAKVDAAAKELEAAQDRLDKITAAKSALEQSIRAQNNEDNNPCGWGGPIMTQTQKTYRHIDIRGHYLLISEGTDTCYSNVINTYTGSTWTASPISNATLAGRGVKEQK